jgi:queuosine precursor transporter
VKATLLAIAFLGCVVGANWAVSTFGMVPVGFGMVGPAGLYFAGLSFGLRDALHEVAGRVWVLALIVAGAGLSWFIEPTFAVASGTAFLVAELADFAVYTPLRERNWKAAVIASNVVGSIVDSAIFLWLAFGSLAHIEGQVWGKALMILPAMVIVGRLRVRRVPK